MASEIVLTRLFSVVLWYHFAFFAISVALLGLGAGAIAVHTRRERLLRATTPMPLCIGALVVGASLLVLDIGLLRVTPDWFGAGVSSFFTTVTLKLLVLFAVTATPFFAAGFVLSLVFMRYGGAIHRLYGWDLCGAGVACLCVVPLLDRLGGPDAIVVSASLAAASSVCFASAHEEGKARRMLLCAVLALGVLAAGSGASATGLLRVRLAKGLDLTAQPPEAERWNSFSLVSVFTHWPFRGWGLSPAYTGPVAAQKGLVIDLNAFTPLTQFDGDFAKVAYTQHDLSAFAFRLRPSSENVCIVGAGGGKDVLAALAAKSRHVVGVEVNPLIAEMVRTRYGAFTGGLYDRKDVEIHVEDGRSFLRASDRRYDVILISMVDTSAATSAGAFALAENALYTSDAFEDFLERLSPDGMLTVSSVSFEGLAVGARLASLARAALSARGAGVERSVAVVQTPWLGVPGAATMYNFILKPSGFSASEEAALRREAEALQFTLAYTPTKSVADAAHPATPQARTEQIAIDRILREPSDAVLARVIATWPLDVSPVSDDRPFFFYQNRLRDAGAAFFSSTPTHLFGNGLVILIKVLVTATLMLVLLIAVPLWRMRNANAAQAASSSGLAVDLAYVGCVGLGFMFLEIALIQRLLSYLGQPTYTLTAVLFVLLLGGGFGSRYAAQWSAESIRRALFGLAIYALLFAISFDAIADATSAFSMTGRALCVAALLWPLGTLLGVPLPSALARVHARHADRIPWLWGINSAASVLGSIAATIVSMSVGIPASLAVGIAFYVAAALLWPKLARAR